MTEWQGSIAGLVWAAHTQEFLHGSLTGLSITLQHWISEGFVTFLIFFTLLFHGTDVSSSDRTRCLLEVITSVSSRDHLILLHGYHCLQTLSAGWTQSKCQEFVQKVKPIQLDEVDKCTNEFHFKVKKGRERGSAVKNMASRWQMRRILVWLFSFLFVCLFVYTNAQFTVSGVLSFLVNIGIVSNLGMINHSWT